MSVRTTMLSLCSLKISYVFKFKISITLLVFPECRGEVNTFPTAKLEKITIRPACFFLTYYYWGRDVIT